MRLHGVRIFWIKSQICVPQTAVASSCLPRLCLFSFRHSYFCLSPLLGFRTYYILSLFSNLSYFPLELSLHTIANNPAEESHLCSWAFSIIHIFLHSLKKKKKKPHSWEQFQLWLSRCWRPTMQTLNQADRLKNLLPLLNVGDFLPVLQVEQINCREAAVLAP